MNDQKKDYDGFLGELTELSRKYGLAITGCTDGSATVYEMASNGADDNDWNNVYSLSSDGQLVFE